MLFPDFTSGYTQSLLIGAILWLAITRIFIYFFAVSKLMHKPATEDRPSEVSMPSVAFVDKYQRTALQSTSAILYFLPVFVSSTAIYLLFYGEYSYHLQFRCFIDSFRGCSLRPVWAVIIVLVEAPCGVTLWRRYRQRSSSPLSCGISSMILIASAVILFIMGHPTSQTPKWLALGLSATLTVCALLLLVGTWLLSRRPREHHHNATNAR